jgi:membrane protein
MNTKSFINLVKETVSEWSEDKASRLAAALSYYTTFSLPPLLVLIISLLGLVGYGNLAQTGILDQVGNLTGEDGRELVEGMVQAASARSSTGITATIVSLVILIFGALGVFGQLQEALNTIWEVAPKPKQGVWETIKSLIFKRLLSFSMILVIGFLLLVSLVLSAALANFGEFLGSILPLSDFILQILNFIISFGVITALFALIYKILPDVEMEWKDVLLGAAITSLLFTIGKFLIGLYLGRSNVATTFGAAGSLVLLLLWIYYSAQIIFLGAEFTQVYANMYGSKVRPDEDAVLVTEEARAKQGLQRREAPTGEPAAPQTSPLLAPTGSMAVEGAPLVSPFGARERGQSGRGQFGYVYRDQEGRKGIFGKVFYSLLVASQFIPSVVGLAKAKSTTSRAQDFDTPEHSSTAQSPALPDPGSPIAQGEKRSR